MVTAYQPSPGASTEDRPKCAALRGNLKGLPWHVKGVSKVSIRVWGTLWTARGRGPALGVPTVLEAQYMERLGPAG